MIKYIDKTSNQSNPKVYNFTEAEKEQLLKFLKKGGLKETNIKTIKLVLDGSKGRCYFETTLEELARIFYSDYDEVKRTKVDDSKKYKSNIRSRLAYFEHKWQKKNKKIYFTTLSKECAGVCTEGHSWLNPNPDKIKIKLNFLTEFVDGNNRYLKQAV